MRHFCILIKCESHECPLNLFQFGKTITVILNKPLGSINKNDNIQWASSTGEFGT